MSIESGAHPISRYGTQDGTQEYMEINACSAKFFAMIELKTLSREMNSQRVRILIGTVESPTTDSPITETYTMRAGASDPNSFPIHIVDCTLRPPYSGNLPTLNYGHRNHTQMDKFNTNFPLKVDRLMQD